MCTSLESLLSELPPSPSATPLTLSCISLLGELCGANPNSSNIPECKRAHLGWKETQGMPPGDCS